MLMILNTHLHTILYSKLDLFSEDKNKRCYIPTVAVGMEFPFPFPSHSHRNPVGIPMGIPIGILWESP